MGTAICAACGENCRGRCGRCGARLCAKHKPKSARQKCPVCPGLGSLRSAASKSRGVPGGALMSNGQPYYVSSAQAKVFTPPCKRLKEMDELEACQHLEDLRDRLLAKQKRERAYLDRRAASGRHTPTDDAYEADQVLENELLELIDQILSEVQH